MSIIVNVDVMMAKRKMSSKELAEKISKPSARLLTASRATFWNIARIDFLSVNKS